MSAFKMYTIEELRKLSRKDLIVELKKAKSEFTHRSIHVRLGEDKQSHMLTLIRKYIAKINTINSGKAA